MIPEIEVKRAEKAIARWNKKYSIGQKVEVKMPSEYGGGTRIGEVNSTAWLCLGQTAVMVRFPDIWNGVITKLWRIKPIKTGDKQNGTN